MREQKPDKPDSKLVRGLWPRFCRCNSSPGPEPSLLGPMGPLDPENHEILEACKIIFKPDISHAPRPCALYPKDPPPSAALQPWGSFWGCVRCSRATQSLRGHWADLRLEPLQTQPLKLIAILLKILLELQNPPGAPLRSPQPSQALMRSHEAEKLGAWMLSRGLWGPRGWGLDWFKGLRIVVGFWDLGFGVKGRIG